MKFTWVTESTLFEQNRGEERIAGWRSHSVWLRVAFYLFHEGFEAGLLIGFLEPVIDQGQHRCQGRDLMARARAAVTTVP